jgi:hypothetical protein
VNELESNPMKHGFPGDRGGMIHVRLLRGPTDLTIIVEDDGAGCPEDAQVGLGSRLVVLPTQQSGGSIKREQANQDAAYSSYFHTVIPKIEGIPNVAPLLRLRPPCHRARYHAQAFPTFLPYRTLVPDGLAYARAKPGFYSPCAPRCCSTRSANFSWQAATSRIVC